MVTSKPGCVQAQLLGFYSMCPARVAPFWTSSCLPVVEKVQVKPNALNLLVSLPVC